VAVHACNPSTQEAEEDQKLEDSLGYLVSLRLVRPCVKTTNKQRIRLLTMFCHDMQGPRHCQLPGHSWVGQPGSQPQAKRANSCTLGKQHACSEEHGRLPCLLLFPGTFQQVTQQSGGTACSRTQGSIPSSARSMCTLYA
jgi:hypothetical protein